MSIQLRVFRNKNPKVANRNLIRPFHGELDDSTIETGWRTNQTFEWDPGVQCVYVARQETINTTMMSATEYIWFGRPPPRSKQSYVQIDSLMNWECENVQ